jgi:HD superfamily phosphodiesterase
LPDGLAPEHLALYERALPLLDTRQNDLHARIACQFSLAILEAEGGDPRVAVPAMILHDLGWHEIPEEEQRRAYGPNSSDAELNRLHEQAGARLARVLLEEKGFEAGLIDEICRIIDRHDSRPTAATLEEAAVKDSDKVWRVSKLGFPATVALLGDMSSQQVHDFIAVRASRWFLTTTGLALARRELAARRQEYRLAPPPDVPPPPGYGIGDIEDYSP